MADDIDIEEHDLMNSSKIKGIFPDLSIVKTEIFDEYEIEQPSSQSPSAPSTSEFPDSTTDDLFPQPVAAITQMNKLVAIPELANNKIVLGNKKAVEDRCFYSYVSVENMSEYLENSNCYCKECLILFPTVNAIDYHKMQVHSYLVAVDAQEVDTFDEEEEEQPICNSITIGRNKSETNVCFVCSQSLPTKDDLIQHIYSSHLSVYTCDVCAKEFRDKSMYDEHVTTHTNQSVVYVCSQCSCQFNKLGAFKRHSVICHNQNLKPIKSVYRSQCKYCPQVLTSTKYYNKHILYGHCGYMINKKNSQILKKPTAGVPVFGVQKPGSVKAVGNKSTASAVPKPSGSAVPKTTGSAVTKTTGSVVPKTTVSTVPKLTGYASQVNFKFKCTICKIIFPNYNHARSHRRKKHPSHAGINILQKVLEKKPVAKTQKPVMKPQIPEVKTQNAVAVTPTVAQKPVNKAVFVQKTALFKCPKCLLHFTKWTAASLHCRSKCTTNQKITRCQPCNVKFTAPEIIEHKKQHKLSSKFDIYDATIDDIHLKLLCKCPNCWNHLKEQDIIEHYSNCNKSSAKNYNCDLCGITIDLSLKKIHEFTHSELNFNIQDFIILEYDSCVSKLSNYLHQCHNCLAVYIQDKNKIHAKKLCKDEARYYCRYCGLYVTDKSYNSHLEQHELFKYTLRDYIFLLNGQTVHPSMPVYYLCKKCNVNFSVENLLKSHVCGQIDTFKCDVCHVVMTKNMEKHHMAFHRYNVHIHVTNTVPGPSKKVVPKDTQNEVVVSRSKVNLVESAINLTYCKNCKNYLCVTKMKKGIHISGKCKKLPAYHCKVCGLQMTKSSHCIHKLAHISPNNYTIKHYTFRDFDDLEKIVKPNNLNLKKCNLCKIHFISLKELRQHTFRLKKNKCRPVKSISCDICSIELTPRAHYAHHQIHILRNEVDKGDKKLIAPKGLNISGKERSERKDPYKVTQCYKCKVCYAYPPSKMLSTQHICNGKPKHTTKTCIICRLRFGEKVYWKHQALHLIDNELKDKMEVIPFNAPVEETIGMVSTGETYFQCTKCFICTQAKHNDCGVSRILCTKCGMYFSPVSFQYHTQIHVLNPNLTKKDFKFIPVAPQGHHVYYQCNVCECCFNTTKLATEHDCSDERFHCDVCQYYFPSNHGEDHKTKLDLSYDFIEIVKHDKEGGPNEVKVEIRAPKAITVKTDVNVPKRAVKRKFDGTLVANSVYLYKCTCGLHFNDQTSAFEHSDICGIPGDKSKGAKCTKCLKILESTNLEYHMAIHTINDIIFNVVKVDSNRKRIYKCIKCDCIFLTCTDLINHNKNCIDEGVDCSCGFKIHKDIIEQHKKDHGQIVHVVYMEEINADEKNTYRVFKCIQCDLHYLSTASLAYHYDLNHLCAYENKICEYCKLKFTAKTLVRHLRTHHQPNKISVIQIADRYNKVLNEITVKRDEARFAVDTKYLKVDDVSDVQVDEKLLEGVLYKCMQCAVHFATEAECNLHIANKSQRYHDKTEKVFCFNCNGFIFQEDFESHLKDHSKIKTPFKIINIKRVENDLSSQEDIGNDVEMSETDVDTTLEQGGDQVTKPDLTATEQVETVKKFFIPAPTKKAPYNDNVLEEDSRKLYRCVFCEVCIINRNSFLRHKPGRHKRIKEKIKCDICGLLFGLRIIELHKELHHFKYNYKLEDFQIFQTEHPVITENTIIKYYNDKCYLNIKFDTSGDCTEVFIDESENHSEKLMDTSSDKTIETPEVKHKTTSIDETLRTIYKCNSCNIHVIRESSFQLHCNTKHKLTNAKCYCPHCGLSFGQITLNHHIKLHHEENNFSLKDFIIIDSNKIISNAFSNNISLSDVNNDTSIDNSMNVSSELEIDDNRTLVDQSIIQDEDNAKKAKTNELPKPESNDMDIVSNESSKTESTDMDVVNNVNNKNETTDDTNSDSNETSNNTSPLEDGNGDDMDSEFNLVESYNRIINEPDITDECLDKITKDINTNDGNNKVTDAKITDKINNVDIKEGDTLCKILSSKNGANSNYNNKEDKLNEISNTIDDKEEETVSRKVTIVDESSSDSSSSESDIKQMNTDEKLKIYQCIECQVNFTKQTSCIKHIKKHEKLTTYDYIACKVCTLNFTLSSIATHMAMHKKIKFTLKEVFIEAYDPDHSKTEPKDVYLASDKIKIENEVKVEMS